MENLVSKTKLLEYGVQFGHTTRRWNPAMKPFIHTSKKGIHIINLHKTLATLQNAYIAVEAITEKGGSVLFVGTTKQSKKTIKENSIRAGLFYVDHRWLGGTLTNWKTIQNSIKRLRELERLEKREFLGYTKKEGIYLKKELDKLEKNLGGIKYMRRLPTAIFVTSIDEEDIAVKEAKKLGIPVFGIVDTNVNPRTIEFPIVANDDANKSVSLITTLMADAVVSAKGGQRLVAGVDEEDVKVLGVEIRQKPNSKDVLSRAGRNRVSHSWKSKIEKEDYNKKTIQREDDNQKIVEEKTLEAKEDKKKATSIDWTTMKKLEIQEQLTKNSVDFDDKMLKDELIKLAIKNIK